MNHGTKLHEPENRGRPSAVLLSAEEYEALEETLEIVQDKELMDALQRSERDVKAGRLTSLTDLRRERR